MCMLLKRIDQIAILDIMAEGVEIDFGAIEFDLRRAPEPAGVIDNPHDPQRRSVRNA